MNHPVKVRAVCYNIHLTQNDFDKIESIIHRVVIFDDADACVDYVTNLADSNRVLLIVPDVSRSSPLVSVILALHDFDHVIGIYVLSESKCTGKPRSNNSYTILYLIFGFSRHYESRDLPFTMKNGVFPNP